MLPARHTLFATQLVFFGCVVACVIVDPTGQAEQDGISYYGVHAPTLPLVAIAYGVGALGTWRTAHYLDFLDVSIFVTVGLRVVTWALPLELVTPFNRGSLFNWSHMSIGIVIGVTQMAIGTLLMWRCPRRAWPLFTLQLLGGLLAAVSLPDWGVNHMFEGELLFEAGFSGCLLMWTYVASARKTSLVNG